MFRDWNELMNKVLKFLKVLSLTTILSTCLGFISDVSAADYYIDTYSDGVSVWVVDTDKTGSDKDKYITDIKFVYPKGNYDEETLVFQRKSDGHWYYGYGNDSDMTLVQNDDASNDILYYVLNH